MDRIGRERFGLGSGELGSGKDDLEGGTLVGLAFDFNFPFVGSSCLGELAVQRYWEGVINLNISLS